MPPIAGALGTFGALIKNEQEWCIAWICSNSDATPSDILKAKTSDKESINKIMQAATQMELKTKLIPHLVIEDILWVVLKKLHVRYGDRLAQPFPYILLIQPCVTNIFIT